MPAPIRSRNLLEDPSCEAFTNAGGTYTQRAWLPFGTCNMTAYLTELVGGRYAFRTFNGNTGTPPGPGSYVVHRGPVSLPRGTWVVFGFQAAHAGGDASPSNLGGLGILAWTIRNVTRSLQWNEPTGTWTADGAVTRDQPFTVLTDFRAVGPFWVPLNDPTFQDGDLYELRNVAQYAYSSSGVSYDGFYWLGPYHRKADTLTLASITQTPRGSRPPRYL